MHKAGIKNILFITIAWPASGEKNLYSDLMDEFVRQGHKVYVAGNQTSKDPAAPFRAEEKGITVLRIRTGKIRKASYLQKALSLLTLGRKISKALKVYLDGVTIDLIIAPTPPITLSFLYKNLKKKYGAPFYLLLKDMWPQGSVDLRVFRKYSIPWIFFRSHEIRIYKLADYIGCMSPLGISYILKNNSFIPERKLEVCPNSIHPAVMAQAEGSAEIRSKYNIPTDACVFIFSGNLGVGHGLHFLVEAIRALSDYPKAYFIIGGSGTHFKYLESGFSEFSPKNALLYNWLPREDFVDILKTSDVGLILLYKYTSPQFPSRILSYLEYSKATLCAVNASTDIGEIVESTGSGLSVEHGNLEEFIKSIKYLSEHPSERKKMGENGHKLLMDQFTVEKGYGIITNHFQK